jgi:hypothetical protein
MTFEKIIGWILLFLGIAVIFYSIYSSFDIFTGVKEAPEIFKVAEKQTVLPKKIEPSDIQGQMEKLVEKQLTGLMPFGSISIVLNLMSWSIFAGILIFAGAQMSGLGIKLIKN